MNDQPCVLIVDDDEGIRRTLEMILTKKNYQAFTAPDGMTALALAQERAFNLALLDIRLPDIAGTDLLAQLKTLRPDLEALITTGHATLESAIQVLATGAYHYFIKPLNVDELLVTLEKALHKQRLVLENRRLLQGAQSELEERKRAEEALERERTLLRTLMDNLPDRVYVKDRSSRFLLNNAAHLQALGAKSPDEAIGKTDFDFRSKELAERYLADDRQVLESGHPLTNREEPSPLPNGEQRWLLVTKVPLRDKQGSIVGLIGVSRDITERKRAEEALRESETKYRTPVENSLIGIGISEGNRIVYANQALMAMYGFTNLEEFTSKPLLDYLTPQSQTFIRSGERKRLTANKCLSNSSMRSCARMGRSGYCNSVPHTFPSETRIRSIPHS